MSIESITFLDRYMPPQSIVKCIKTATETCLHESTINREFGICINAPTYCLFDPYNEHTFENTTMTVYFNMPHTKSELSYTQ